MYSEKLQRHIDIMFSKGSMYLRYNSNLLYHACIPVDEDGNFVEMELEGEKYSGKAYLEKIEQIVRMAYLTEKKMKRTRRNQIFLVSMVWKKFPSFGKNDMKTFERYFINDKLTHKEEKIHIINF